MKMDYQEPIILIVHTSQDVITESNPKAENDFPDPFSTGTFAGGYVEGGLTQ